MLMRFSHTDAILPCSCDSPTLMRTGSRRRFAEEGVHSGRRRKTELAGIHEAEGLKKQTMISEAEE